MKTGFRTPSVKKSVKGRTTGKINRAMKSSVDPTYGKKGVGLVKDPDKAIYNKIYNKTTVGVNPIAEDSITNGSFKECVRGIFDLLKTLIQLIISLIQLAFWGAVVFGSIYFIIKMIF